MYYSLFLTLLSKVIDSRLRVDISHWFTTYHFKTSKGIETEMVTSPDHYWLNIPAALIQIMSYKSAECRDSRDDINPSTTNLADKQHSKNCFDTSVWRCLKRLKKNSRNLPDPKLRRTMKCFSFRKFKIYWAKVILLVCFKCFKMEKNKPV